MRFCRKIKECVLCGKSGHNPLNCFIHSSSLTNFMSRAKQLNRCAECLTLFTTDTNKCTHCSTRREYWDPWRQWTHMCYPKIIDSESQTETKNCKNQESHTEPQQTQTIIEYQRSEIEECNKKVAILENELEHCVSVKNNLNSQLQNTILEKEQALQKADDLQLACHARDVKLVEARAAVKELQEEFSKKALQLEQYKTLNAQSSKVTPGTRSKDSTCVDELQNKVYGEFIPNTLHQPHSIQIASNNSEHINELNYIKT